METQIFNSKFLANMTFTTVVFMIFIFHYDAQAAGPCDSPANSIVVENCLIGNPSSEWDVAGEGDTSIQGFATDISVNQGQTVSFKVKTNATNYRLDIYRMGYYGGMGARKIATALPSAALPQNQPACLSEVATGLVDCGNWAVSASWSVPANATSGIYFARLVRPDTGGDSHIVFIVRNDTSNSNLLFQTSDTTWQAYNDYTDLPPLPPPAFGNSLYRYPGSPVGRAYKVSYNRPLNTRGNPFSRAGLFGAEYPMVRWLEANGYDISYTTGVDTDRRGSELLEHNVFLSVGHDEYWSAGQRANVEAARNAGVNLAFFSGNEVFWKTRWENSIDGSGMSHRTLVSYKETKVSSDPNTLINLDPTSIWTGTWRDPRSSNIPTDGGRPENALTGTIFTANCCLDGVSLTVPQEYGRLRFWRDTNIATLLPGLTASLPAGILGYEFDEALDNGHSPNGLIKMSKTVVNLSGDLYLLDYGNTYGSGIATHSLTLYRHTSGALVFGAGTVRWSWGLDNNHDFDFAFPTASNMVPDSRMKQATVNLFADMGVQPQSLQVGLVAASQTTDTIPPTSTITSPIAGSSVQSGTTVTIAGTAVENIGGGVVAGVEVSTDNGASWHPANGTGNWSYTWNPSQLGLTTLRSRAIDDSGNREAVGSSVTVTVTTRTCPCTIWSSSATPATASASDPTPVELGVKFRTDVAGSITGIRYYKGAGNTGTHVGKLWTSTGTLLASATFTGETASGWQQVNFSQPVAVTANTVYVASYFAPNGGYAFNSSYFATQGVDNAPLHALQNGVNGGNGVYLESSTGGFPTNTFNTANYWVDVIFSDTVGPDVPPSVLSTTPVSGATGVSTGSTVTVTFSEAMTAATINNSTIELRDAANGLVTASVNYNAAANNATLTPNALLTSNTVYAVKVKSGSTGVKDAAGNALVSDYDWSFTTLAPTGCPCTIWSSSATPATASASDPTPVELGVKFRTDVAGSITGIRYYKGAGNTGTHVGKLWTSTGTLLASATFTGETASGWQQVNFSQPVAVTANTVYVASYYTPSGNYAFNSNYFAAQGTDNAPLHALQNGVSGGNGVFLYGTGGGFPTGTFGSANYWVDVVFNTNTITDNTAPTVVSTTPSNGATGISVGPAVAINFSEAMSAASISNSTIELHDVANTLVGASVSYNPGTFIATLTPNVALATSTVYTARIKSGLTGVKDSAGNALVSDYGWSFTTLSPAIDGILPTTPIGLTASATSISQINLSWTASTDNVGVTGYRVERCLGAVCTAFVQIATPSGVSFPDTGLAATTTYRYRVRATDAAGNLSGYSAVVESTTQSPAIVSTGFLSPTANSAVTSGSGDNNGFQTSPQNAYSSDNLFALDTNSGTTNSSSSTSTGKDRHIYQNFGINIPVGTAIKGIQVRLDARVDSLSTLGVVNTPKMFVQLSWNAGASWVNAKSTATLTINKATYFLGTTADTWGRAWVANDLTNANFRVRIINVASGLLGANDRDFSLDWAAVQVTYQ